MEYIWYIIAALGAGVGTGLAGLSAATVMVPILIVLCPSFAGETGAYHATAIALASDILGSAVTSGIYMKHKNIDLKRGWIMLVCIICMCIAGSLAAWGAGGVVLGGFSLFLCVGIGIRFLVKPDTQRENTVDRGTGLDAKGVIISLFFGLTIGFGTGFVGTGGGMMMLVVFTAFLGMDRKTAVGTSTFIMTFTALIAFISHAGIDPTIMLERADVLVICIVTATLASMISARFANRVNSRTVGLVTGAALTVLGLAMLILNYREALQSCTFIWQILNCFEDYIKILAVCVALLLMFKYTVKPPQELFRKMLHIVAYASSIIMMYSSQDWHVASICCLIFAIFVYPLLWLAERWKGYADLFVERHPGEIKKSLMLLFGTHAALIAVGWGIFDRPYLVVASILMWGVGDAAAALVGKRFGRHHVNMRHADPKKTWEGTAAMAVTAFLTGMIALLVVSTYPWYICVLLALVSAPVAAYTELISHNGNDTVSVASAVLTVQIVMGLLL